MIWTKPGRGDLRRPADGIQGQAVTARRPRLPFLPRLLVKQFICMQSGLWWERGASSAEKGKGRGLEPVTEGGDPHSLFTYKSLAGQRGVRKLEITGQRRASR